MSMPAEGQVRRGCVGPNQLASEELKRSELNEVTEYSFTWRQGERRAVGDGRSIRRW